MQGVIVGIDKLADGSGALKLYVQSCENNESYTSIKKANGDTYVNRIGRQVFDVYLSKNSLERFASLGLNADVLTAFYEKGIALPFTHKSYEKRFFYAFDDFALAALLIQLKAANANAGKEA